MADNIGYGSKFYYETTEGSGTYTQISNVAVTIVPPNVSVGSTDATHLSSADRFREKHYTLGDGQQATLECKWDKTNYNTMYGMLFSKRKWKVEFPDTPASILVFTGFIVGYGTEMPLDNLIMNTFTFEVSGKPAFTPG